MSIAIFITLLLILFVQVKTMATEAEILAKLDIVNGKIDEAGTDIDALMLIVQQLNDLIANNPVSQAIGDKIDELTDKLTAVDNKFPAPPVP